MPYRRPDRSEHRWRLTVGEVGQIVVIRDEGDILPQGQPHIRHRAAHADGRHDRGCYKRSGRCRTGQHLLRRGITVGFRHIAAHAQGWIIQPACVLQRIAVTVAASVGKVELFPPVDQTNPFMAKVGEKTRRAFEGAVVVHVDP